MKAVSEVGIDRQELREAAQPYCGMMGWDPAAGNPLPATLQGLGCLGDRATPRMSAPPPRPRAPSGAGAGGRGARPAA